MWKVKVGTWAAAWVVAATACLDLRDGSDFAPAPDAGTATGPLPDPCFWCGASTDPDTQLRYLWRAPCPGIGVVVWHDGGPACRYGGCLLACVADASVPCAEATPCVEAWAP